MQTTSFENQAPRKTNHDKSYWRELIGIWQKSNESQKDFCDRMNIKVGTFAHWRGIFTKENKRSTNKFINVQVIPTVRDKADYFTIECQTGHKIIFSASLNLEQVQQIFKLLGLIV